jgi:hypothetical protein
MKPVIWTYDTSSEPRPNDEMEALLVSSICIDHSWRKQVLVNLGSLVVMVPIAVVVQESAKRSFTESDKLETDSCGYAGCLNIPISLAIHHGQQTKIRRKGVEREGW